MTKSKNELVQLDAAKYKQMFMSWRECGMSGGFSSFDKELGLDYLHSEHPSNQYTFAIMDKKQFLLSKIKYGI